jgi:hypothetical protein
MASTFSEAPVSRKVFDDLGWAFFSFILNMPELLQTEWD